MGHTEGGIKTSESWRPSPNPPTTEHGERETRMGVMACDRGNCPEIMCHRVILDNEYICDDCWEELLQAKKGWPLQMAASEVRQRIIDFMKTNPGSYKTLDAGEIDQEFLRLTGKDRRE